jgi:hypothetical protein
MRLGAGAGALALLSLLRGLYFNWSWVDLRMSVINLNILWISLLVLPHPPWDLDIIVDHWVTPGNWTSLASSESLLGYNISDESTVSIRERELRRSLCNAKRHVDVEIMVQL